MNSKCKITLAMLAGAALGAGAIQALHAQAKPLSLHRDRSRSRRRGSVHEFAPKVGAAVAATGGKYLSRGGKIAVA